MYGKVNAANEEVYLAAQLANALDFIESKELGQIFNDTAANLLQAMKSKAFKP